MPVTSVSPTRGGPAGGTQVFVFGSGFTGATQVTFDGIPGTAFTFFSDTAVRATSPAHAVGAVDVTVDVGGTLAGGYTYVKEVTAISPNLGGPSGGTSVTITGNGFTGATQVNIGGVAATSVVVASDAQITCNLPAHAPGVVDVEVVGVGTGTGLFTYDGVDWDNVSIGYGGSNDFRDSTYVSGVGFVFVGDGGLIFTSPTGAPASWTQRTSPGAGTQNWKGIAHSPALSRFVVVGNVGAVATSDDGGVTWTARTAAEANQWASVCWSPGLSLFCAVSTGGTNRVMTSPDGITWTAHAAASAKSWTGVCWHAAAGLFVAIPSQSGSTATDYVMTSPDGSTWTSQTGNLIANVPWAGFGKPIISSSVLAAAAFGTYGDSVGGGGFTTTPIRLEKSAGATAWTHASIPGGLRPERLVDAPALGVVLAVVPWTYLTSPDGVTWTQEDVPTPPVTNFGDFCACWADDLRTLISSKNGTPDKMMRGVWPVTTVPLTLTDVSPATGPDTGGTAVTLTGTGFVDGAFVTFDNVLATSIVFVSDTQITCVTPPHAAGLVPCTVTNPGGAFATLDDAFEYTLTGIDPNSGGGLSPNHGPMLGGTLVTITGVGFTPSQAITFDGISATEITFVNDTTYTCRTPPHSAGPVEVRLGDFVSEYTYDPVGTAGGTPWSGAVRRNPEVTLDRGANRPAQATFDVGTGDHPQAGQALDLTLGTTPYVDGVALQVSETFQERPAQLKRSVSASDFTWLLNARRPFGSWKDVSATVVVGEVMDEFAPDFTRTGLALGLPAVTVELDGSVEFSDALDAIAKAMGGPAAWYLDVRDLHFFATEAATDPDVVTDDLPSLMKDPPVTVTEDVSQIRNRVFGVGKGSQVAGQAGGVGDTVLEVADITPFSRTGGFVRAGTQVLKYTGVKRISQAVPRQPGPGTQSGMYATWEVNSPTANGNVMDWVQYKVSFVDGFGVESDLSGPTDIITPEPQVQPGSNAVFVDNGPGTGSMNFNAGGYLITFFTATGETAPFSSSFIGAAVSADGSSMTISNMTVSNDPRTLGRNIYRKKDVNGHPRFFKIGSVGNSPSDTFTDVLNDDSLHDWNPLVWWEYDLATGKILAGPTNTTGTVMTVHNIARIPDPIGGFLNDVTPVVGSGLVVDSPAAAGAFAVVLSKPSGSAVIRDGNVLSIGGELYQVGVGGTVTGPVVVTLRTALKNDLLGGEPVTLQPIARKLYRAQYNNPGIYRLLDTIENDNTVDSYEDNNQTDPPNILSTPAYTGDQEPAPEDETPGALPPVIHFLLVGIPTVGRFRIRRGIPVDTPVNVWVQRDDVPAQAELASRLGGTGVREFLITDTSRSEAALVDRVMAELTLFAWPIVSVSYTTRDQMTREGRTVTFNLASPPLVGSFKIQTVAKSEINAHEADPKLSVMASSVRFTLDDLLHKVLLDGDSAATHGGFTGGSGGGGGGAVSPAALLATDDENVTAELIGAASVALLQDVIVRLGWQGALSAARGGTGLDNSGAVNGDVLMGRTSDHKFVRGQLTAGAGIVITPGAGSVEISATGGGGGGTGYYSPLTNGDPDAPELIFDSFGDVIMVFNV